MKTLFHASLIVGVILMTHAASAAPVRDDNADVCLKVNKDESVRTSRKAELELAAAECARRLANRMHTNGPVVPSPTNPNDPVHSQEQRASGQQKPTGCVLRPDQPGNCGAPGGR